MGQRLFNGMVVYGEVISATVFVQIGLKIFWPDAVKGRIEPLSRSFEAPFY